MYSIKVLLPLPSCLNIVWYQIIVVCHQLGEKVDMSPFWYQMSNYFETVAPFQDMLDAVCCIRAEGIKTALLTNNWKFLPHNSCPPVERIRNYFDVVSFHFSCACHFLMKYL